MRTLLVALLIVAGGISMGSVAAVEFHNSPPVVVQGGNLNIVDGGMIFTRSDGIQTIMQVRNSDAQTAIGFEDIDSNKQYLLRYTSDGNRMDFLNLDAGVPRVDLSVQTSTGNIGMGTLSPNEKLDVDGNIKLSGNLVSDGDICIGACP